MENKWGKLASVFNLRLFEKFTLDIDRVHEFYFSMHGLAKIGSDDVPQPADEEMKMLLDGEACLTLPQFVPSEKDTYWYWGDGLILKDGCWEETFSDKQRLMTGNCFRTDKEARDGLKELCDSMNTHYKNTLKDVFYKVYDKKE